MLKFFFFQMQGYFILFYFVTLGKDLSRIPLFGITYSFFKKIFLINRILMLYVRRKNLEFISRLKNKNLHQAESSCCTNNFKKKKKKFSYKKKKNKYTIGL